MKFAILTINGMDNFGNRLQNYALQEFIRENFGECETIENIQGLSDGEKVNRKKEIVKNWIRAYIPVKLIWKKYKCYYNFEKMIIKSKFHIEPKYIPAELDNQYDYFITGSDQVWNSYFKRMSDIDFLTFCDKSKRISFSASFGVSYLENEQKQYYRERISEIPHISVREDSAKKIIQDLGVEQDVKVLLDPTMLISAEKWHSIERKPHRLKNKRYIFKYCLGETNIKRKCEIQSLAQEMKCEIIDILDKNSPCFAIGPMEFLYLIEHAEAVITDSFHACVFSILFKIPFMVYQREDGNKDMLGRIETLLDKFDLKGHMYNEERGLEIIPDYKSKNIDDILYREYNKAVLFIRGAIGN